MHQLNPKCYKNALLTVLTETKCMADMLFTERKRSTHHVKTNILLATL